MCAKPNHPSHLWQPGLFNFTGACAAQSRCYDQCEHDSWESCNDLFVSHAVTFCFDNWSKTHWDIVPLMSCLSQAKYYGIYLSSRQGKELFYKAQSNMCACSCASTNTTATCDSDGRLYCADVGADDAKNCGACGRTCGRGSVCRKGRCVCPVAQCGITCVNLQDNPFHCGRCGTTCATGYCLQGLCYNPYANDTLGMPPRGNDSHSAALPDTLTTLPDTSTHLPHTSTRLPEPSTHLPNNSTHLPEPSTHLPHTSTHLPHTSTRLPEPSTHLPNNSTHLPEPSTHLPHTSTRLHDTLSDEGGCPKFGMCLTLLSKLKSCYSEA
ncbi:hypothetical protein E4U41_003414 [Claviceps citrina]|nr:hypothetical protein E4U41_003414 [Claviceps citrina]